MFRLPGIFVGLAGLLTLSPALPAAAQDFRGPLVLAAATRSSPFDPPVKDVFVADDGAGLDTGCTFNTDPNHPLRIDVMIDQAVGEVDGDGHLVNAAALVADGVVPAKVEVILPAFDVDVNGAPPPENDEILFNGERLGLLTGDNEIWKLNSFSVDISKIKFPAPPAAGGVPTPVANRVQINIDKLSTGRWCTAIDWVALALPIRLKVAFTLKPTIGNQIAVREYAKTDTIDIIYQQSFDASCKVKNDIDEPLKEYPFSGPARLLFGLLPGLASLHATLERCPRNDQLTPEVKVEWKIAGTSRKGVASWKGSEGDIIMVMPGTIGAYDVELVFTVDGKKHPAIHRKLFVTRSPAFTMATAGVAAPRVGWYEKATDWAAGLIAEGPILTSLLSREYSFGQAEWRYGYDFGAVDRCPWQDMIAVDDKAAQPAECDYSDCYIFSEVFENMAATLGISGLAPKTIKGSNQNRSFLTTDRPSLDPKFPGSAKPFAGGAYDRYVFSSHSLRLKSSKYYDATFNGTYSTERAFIVANMNGNRGADGSYLTDEGWNIYVLGGTSYDSWGNYSYKAPPPPAPGPVPFFGGLAGQPAASAADIAFTGNATFSPRDEDLNGIAEALRVDVEVRLDAAGQYTFLGSLEKAGQVIANQPSWESMLLVRTSLDEISGTYTITLQLSGEQIYRSGLDGPYELVLDGFGPNGFTSTTLTTPGYDHALFGETPARFTGAAETAVDTNGDGELDSIEATLDLDVRLPAELQLQGDLSKEGETVAQAGTAESLEDGARQVSLLFDGGSIRRSGLDGPYEGSVNLVDADGHTIDGITFTTRPYSAGSFSVLLTPQGPFSDQGIDTNGNGLFDLLRIDFGAEIDRAGSYLLTAVLHDAGSTAEVLADSLLTVPAGPASIRLEFPGPVINDLGLDGPYTVDVLVRDAATLKELDAVRLPQTTAAYRSTDFDPFGSSNLPIVLTGNFSESGVDTNGNGLYDELRVDVEVALAQTDFYEWSARLVDRNGTEIGFDSRQGTLQAGVTSLRLVFDGEAIGKNGVDGPYFVKGLLIFGSRGANLVSLDVGETRPYPVTAFEGGIVPPIAQAGPDQRKECASRTGTAVVLDGSGSQAPSGRPLSYVWTGPFPEGGGRVTGVRPTVTLPLGISTITLRVNDGIADSIPDTVVVTVVDTTPPQISASLSPALLWPPNHQMTNIAAAVKATDLCSVPRVVLTSLISSEPDDAPGGSDGNTKNDIQGVTIGTADFLFSLRAERSGSGRGRIYTARYTAIDGSGNQAQARAEARVPHNR